MRSFQKYQEDIQLDVSIQKLCESIVENEFPLGKVFNVFFETVIASVDDSMLKQRVAVYEQQFQEGFSDFMGKLGGGAANFVNALRGGWDKFVGGLQNWKANAKDLEAVFKGLHDDLVKLQVPEAIATKAVNAAREAISTSPVKTSDLGFTGGKPLNLGGDKTHMPASPAIDTSDLGFTGGQHLDLK